METFLSYPYCGNTIVDMEVMKSGKYRRSQVIGLDSIMPNWALPFQLKSNESDVIALWAFSLCSGNNGYDSCP